MLNHRLVDGQEIGKLLVETGVPVLVLNACRSAFADASSSPEQARAGDVHSQVRAFGSFGRVYLGGEERDIDIGYRAAEQAIADITGRTARISGA